MPDDSTTKIINIKTKPTKILKLIVGIPVVSGEPMELSEIELREKIDDYIDGLEEANEIIVADTKWLTTNW